MWMQFGVEKRMGNSTEKKWKKGTKPSLVSWNIVNSKPILHNLKLSAHDTIIVLNIQQNHFHSICTMYMYIYDNTLWNTEWCVVDVWKTIAHCNLIDINVSGVHTHTCTRSLSHSVHILIRLSLLRSDERHSIN